MTRSIMAHISREHQFHLFTTFYSETWPELMAGPVAMATFERYNQHI